LIININQLFFCEPGCTRGKISAGKAKIRTFVSSLRELISNLSSGITPGLLTTPITFDARGGETEGQKFAIDSKSLCFIF